MKVRKNLALVCAALVAVPAAAWAETAGGSRDAAALATTDSNTNFGSIIRKDEDKISIFNDLVTVNGEFRVRIDSEDTAASYAETQPKDNTHSEFNMNLWLRAKLYKDWKLVTQIEPNIDLETGKFRGDHDIPMVKLYGEGTVYDFGGNAGSLKARLGKFGALSSYGRVWDTEVTGGELFWDNKILPTKLTAGRRTGGLNGNVWGSGINGKDEGIGGRRKKFVTLQSMYPVNDRINVGATVSYMKDLDMYDFADQTVRMNAKDALFGELGMDVKLNDDWRWMIAGSKSNIKAYNDNGVKIKNDGLFTELRYKLADWNQRNSYHVAVNYRRVGALSGVSSIEDYSKNVQGVQLAAAYIPWKNWKLSGFYLHGKQVTPVGAEKLDVNVVRGQLEYKF
ncbi:hypothetical protein [Neisseria animalis]|uniref:Porin n=1 Tax=Neisseria animalis TaxID=492 RepID=A0A5P3MUX1_NEIAN|nr:hypothetical protein [Neisseria animalis]QEY24875.1 hypothetical protein D0T90_10675 [Neisseria animalis]ROW32405.1 hypothetical protein CGZ60_04630 [Neisseria animalis]VEE08065.1 Uncharacterised protein [Neisseria animalis]